METRKVVVQSFKKPSINDPWVVAFIAPTQQVIRYTIGDGGEVPVGPRLYEVLSSMEGKIASYPYQYVSTETERMPENTFDARLDGEFLLHIEATVTAHRYFMGMEKLPAHKNDWTEILPAIEEEVSEFSAMAKASKTSASDSTIPKSGYLVYGKVADVIDGDTFDMKIEWAADKAKKDSRIAVGKEITVRLSAVNAPETKKSSKSEKANKEGNYEYMNRYKVTAEEAFEIAIEAFGHTDRILHQAGYIVLDVDATEDGKPKFDMYDRVLAAVYTVKPTSLEKAMVGGPAIHLNKYLLATKTVTVKKDAPLAAPFDHFIDNEYSRLPQKDWLVETGARKPESKEPAVIGEAIAKEKKARAAQLYESGSEIEDGATIEIVYEDNRNNQFDFFEAYDDRYDEIFPRGLDHQVRIGDVGLIIPPLAITTERVSTLNKIKTLRSKSSMIIKGGSSTTTLQLQLYFHDVEAINGRKVKMHKDLDRNYYLDGLRPLLAQFKKAPFLPIDNVYINETLGIHSVALMDLSVQTVPGFPHSLSATLTLAKFDHEAYMPNVSHLGEVINYPMLRWYYQEPMRDDIAPENRSPYRTYLEPIPSTGYTNELVFAIADESQLALRKQALQNIRNLDAPAIAESKFIKKDGESGDANTKNGKIFSDGKAAQKVLNQHSIYTQLKKDGKVPTKRSAGGYVPDFNKISSESQDKVARSAFHAIYGNKTDEEVLKVSHYAPFESAVFATESSLPEKTGGVIKLRLFDKDNINLFPKANRASAKTEGNMTVLELPATEIGKLEKIVSRGLDAEKAYLADLDKWKKADALLRETEADITMVEAELDIIPTSLTVMYENQFSKAQLQALEGPTLQFLGGQDPYVQLNFETDEEGVKILREDILEKAEQFSREFRTGITSGFVGVRNQLLQMFGITTVMPETMQVRTVPGFPGRFDVQMTLCGFNKTQKRMEQLEGISSVYGQMNPSDRKVGKFEPAHEDAVIEHRMDKLEIYPDLELPTYDELNAALPYIDAKIREYVNRLDNKYLDPDFYFAAPITMREIVREERTKEQTFSMKDFMGVEMTTSSQSTNPLDGDKNMWEILNALDASSTKINPVFSWEGNAGDAAATDGTAPAEAPTFASPEVAEFVKDKDKVNAMPTLKEWSAWGKGSNPQAYDAWKKKINPEEWQVYDKIYYWVDQLWVKGKHVYNDKTIKPTNKVWQKIAYSSNSDMYAVNYNYLAKKDPNLVKGKDAEVKGKLTQKDYKSTKSKVPRERIANIIKAVFHATSKWKQGYGNNMPILDSMGNASGIGGVPLSSEAGDISTAKRLLWDWEYNVEVAIKQLFEGYEAALASPEMKHKSRPWDWMVAAYSTGTIDTDGSENAFYQQVKSIHANYYNSVDRVYGTPTAMINPRVMQQKEGLNTHEYGVVTREKDAMIAELIKTGYVKDKKSKAETKTWLETQTQPQVLAIYESYISDKLGTPPEEREVTVDNAYMIGKVGTTASQAATAKGSEVIDENIKLEDIADFIDNTEMNRLVNQSNPQEVFPEMFRDITDYDQKLRMVRAFPTFQMFIIDEGRWMTNYRLWDNLYGFNAIQSIDVHKSRKIAADTAIIDMTNVYSNLTSRPMDTSYGDWDYSFLDNLVFGNPSQSILDVRKELLNSMLLQTGARIHLRIGYGSSVKDLPVVFNGTITEMNVNDMIQIVAQGDGIELGNVISGDPGDENKSFLKGVTEPRDLLCELMTSKGNWFKDITNATFDGLVFRDNPLGIQHFGQSFEKEAPEGTWKFFNDDYGEAAQNIYSSNGVGTFNQWTYQDGSDIPWSYQTPVLKWAQPGDEQNVVVPFYNSTFWDVATTLAYCSTDYIAAVHPYEMRSTFFFGKPYWQMAYRYSSSYRYDKAQKSWIRTRNVEHRKPYAQVHLFDSTMDIIGNNINASEDGVYTNVIVNYDGKQTPLIYADYDIRFDKQKTTVVDAQIMSRVSGMDFWTSEKQAMYYGISALRDYMKDMYKGNLVVLGDPTVKPHDICFMQDSMYDMNGNFQVKAVTHHFSHDTGFITSVEPDVMAVSDDMAWMNLSSWVWAMGTSIGAFVLGKKYGTRLIKKLTPSYVSKAILTGGRAGYLKTRDIALDAFANMLPDDDDTVREYKSLLKTLKKMDADDPARASVIYKMRAIANNLETKMKQWEAEGKFENVKGKPKKGMGSAWRMRRTVASIKEVTNSLQDGAQAIKWISRGATLLTVANPVALLATAIGGWAVESIAEKYRRKKATMQAVLVMPLMYQGRQYTAGINGHKGMVVGDKAGKVDNLLSGAGLDGKNDGGMSEWFFDIANFNTSADKDFEISEEDLKNGDW